MKITAIRIRNIKKIGAEGLVLESIEGGLNVLSEPNEFGKSTIFEAIRHGLLTKHSAKTAAIKALQPRTKGGSPIIEIDIDLDGLIFRIRKQFLTQANTTVTDLASGEVIKSADDAQDWIKRAIGADGKNAGPTGLLWVTQGESINSAAQTEDQKEVFSSVLDNEVSTVVSGKRGRDVLAKVHARRAELVTKTGQPAKTYKTAATAYKQLVVQEGELLKKMEQAEKALTRIAAVKHEVIILSDPQRDQDLLKDQEKAEDLYQEALQAAPKLSELETKRDAAHASLENLVQLQTTLTSDIAAGRELSTEVATLTGYLETLKKTLVLEEAHYLEVLQENTSAKEAYDAARIATLAAYKSRDAYEAKTGLPLLEKKLEGASNARDKLEGFQAKLTAMRVDKQAIDNLSNLSQSIELIQAKRDAGRTKVSIRYNNNPAVRFQIDGEELIEDQMKPVNGALVIEVPGTGRVHVETPAGADQGDYDTQYENAVTKLQEVLQEYGVKDLEAARVAEAARYKIKEHLRETQLTLAQNASEGLAVLRSQVTAAKEKSSHSDENALDVADAIKAETLAEAEHAQLSAQERVTNAAIQVQREKFSNDETRQSGLQKELSSLCDRIGAVDLWAGLEKEALKQSINAREARDHAAAEFKSFKDKAPNLEATKVSVDRALKAISNRQKKFQDLSLELEGLKGQIQTLQAAGIEEELMLVQDKISGADTLIERFKDEVRALDLLLETLEGAQESEKTKLFTPVVNELKPLISQVLPGTEIHIGDDFSANEIIRNGIRESVDTLSLGTQEQIAILTRLAFARLKAKQGHPTPVILDDAIVFSDDGRITDMFTALNMVAADLQILVLTCRQKSFEGLGGNLLTACEWVQGNSIY